MLLLERSKPRNKGGRVLSLLFADAVTPLEPVGQVRVHLRPIAQVIENGRVGLVQRQSRKALSNGLGRLLAVDVLVEHRFDPDTRAHQPDVIRCQEIEVVF